MNPYIQVPPTLSPLPVFYINPYIQVPPSPLSLSSPCPFISNILYLFSLSQVDEEVLTKFAKLSGAFVTLKGYLTKVSNEKYKCKLTVKSYVHVYYYMYIIIGLLARRGRKQPIRCCSGVANGYAEGIGWMDHRGRVSYRIKGEMAGHVESHRGVVNYTHFNNC